ncbi:MAG TPA: phosphatase PAP2 family protein [Gaiellaceae bacterium]|nr:phosphatase PAP2 family protein [Gaiellaceae bacterium]
MSSTEISSPRTQGTAIPRRLRSSMEDGLVREVALVTGAILAYFTIRNVTAGAPGEAFANGERIVDFEQWLGIHWEDAVQRAIVGRDGVVTFANWIYIWGHWPVILSAAVALHVWRRDRYYLLRNTLFISGGIGFLFFAFFPVAPPRLLELGLVDTVSDQSQAYRALQPPGLTNQYASFPSLHVGWNLAVGVVLFMTTTHLVVRTFAVLSPLAMTFAVVATANHFVVDIAGGAAVVLVGLAGAHIIEKRRSVSLATLAGDGPVISVEHPRRRPAPVPRRPPRREPPRRSPRRRTTQAEPCRS